MKPSEMLEIMREANAEEYRQFKAECRRDLIIEGLMLVAVLAGLVAMCVGGA